MRALWRATTSRSWAASTRPRASSCCRGPRRSAVHPSGSAAGGQTPGLRRTARLADGWLASAYNTTPAEFACRLGRASAAPCHRGQGQRHLPERAGDDVVPHHRRHRRSRPRSFANGSYRPSTGPRTCSGSGFRSGPHRAFAEKLRAFRDAGVQQVLVWPVTDEERQLELFCEQVIPLVDA